LCEVRATPNLSRGVFILTTEPAKLVQAGAIAIMAVALGCASIAVPASAVDNKPYDDKLVRLSELLGSVHYLRELCGANEGALWRDRMKDLVDAESSSALRRARLTRSFNQGYTSFSRTYKTCTPSAQTTITRFLNEGTQIAETLVKATP
jgi:uncharacterized protein (TIGR02301 family)